MKTLYVSDLDGTLLRSNEMISEYSVKVINSLIDKGMIFSYATARSLISASRVTKGLSPKVPLIIYNGAFIIDGNNNQILLSNLFGDDIFELIDRLFKENVYPIVYSFIDGKEKFSICPEVSTPGVLAFLESRKNDIRRNVVNSPEELKNGEIFYITCIDEKPDKLERLYNEFKDRYRCVFQKDIYSDDHWLEFMPKNASKANAVKQLKEMLGCDRVVAFGDGRNDIDLLESADEGYAVSNAHEDLKKVAKDIILSNDEDGVARFLENRI